MPMPNQIFTPAENLAKNDRILARQNLITSVSLLLVAVVLLGSIFTRVGDSGQGKLFAWNPLQFLKNLTGNQSAAPAQSPAGATTTVIKVVSEESQVIDVVKKNSPAVVSIIESAEVPKYEQCYQNVPTPDVPQDMQQFFNFDIPSVCQNGTEQQQVGAGSGFIVSADGYIVTNKHVVEDPSAEYTVILNDEKNMGKKVTAKVLARDPDNDIAVLKIDMTDLPYVNFGDSSQLQVGQTAIAIGYALGQFDNTVTKGVISGLSRSITAGGLSTGDGSETLTGLIQTDAAINPGNSGGPLLDISGDAIGMDTAMADGQSLGFAIPINLVKAAFEQVKNSGTITAAAKAYLGVRYIPVTAEIQSANKLPYDYGMLVARGDTDTDLAVLPGSPADKAGIMENDIILEADGKQLDESYTLSDAIAAKKPGDSIALKIFHKGNIKTISIKLDKQ
jgi:serine protease Do